MIVEALKRFKDIDAGVLRDAGDRFEVSPERFAAINGTRYGSLVTEVVESVNDTEKPSDETQRPSEGAPKARRQRKKTVKAEE